ncbi:MAG: hypothetical protein OXG23_15375 [Chloroflexi bacterium]|nr:hypothetical protein [Chloroflexota bacterium]
MREEIVEADLLSLDLDSRILRFKLLNDGFGGPAQRQLGEGGTVLRH